MSLSIVGFQKNMIIRKLLKMVAIVGQTKPEPSRNVLRGSVEHVWISLQTIEGL